MNQPFKPGPTRAALVVALLAGCAGQEEGAEAPTPSVHRPTKSLSDPLTESEVQTFLSVLQELPGRHAPEFKPLAQVTAREETSAKQLAEIYRQEYRVMFDASRHGAQWRKNASLMHSFEKHHTQPEDFAALMIRMSCAVTAGTLSPQVDLARAADKADARVAEYASRIDELDRGSRTPTTVNQRRQMLDGLQELVAFSEFARILMDVPSASCDVVKQYRSQLAQHLPQTGNAEMFEQTTESYVVPTGYHEPNSPESSAPPAQ